MVAQIRRLWKVHPIWSWGAIGVLAAALVVGVFVLPALADTTTLVPMQDVQTASWTQVGGTTTTFWSTIDDNPFDDNTSYISSATNNARALFEITDPTGLSGTIDSVQVTLRVRERTSESATLIYPVISNGTNTILGTGFDVVYSTAGTYYSYTDTFATNPAGGPWTWADLANLRAGCQLTSVSTNLHRVSAVHVTVTYTPDTTPPTLNSASPVDATHVDVAFSEPLDGTSIAASDFTIAGLSVTGATLQPDNVTVRLTTSAQSAQGYTVSCTAGNVLDLAGNGNTAGTANFTGIDGVPPTLGAASTVDSTHVDVVFSEPLDGTSITASDFTIAGLTVSGAALQADNVTVRLTTTTQTPSQGYTVQCAAGNVLDVAGNGNTSGSAGFVGYVPADTTSPTLDSASVPDATHVDVVFSEALDSTSITASDFTIAGLSVSAATLQPDNVTVRLTTSAQSAQGYTVQCAVGNVLDLAGNGNIAGSANFTGIDGVAPTLDSASAVDSTHVDVVFSEALQSGSIAASDFTIAGLTVSGAVLRADNVTVRLTTSAQSAQAYTVQCAVGNVLDIAGNGNAAGSAGFTGIAAPDTTPPTMASAVAIDATTVDVAFSEPLQPGSITASDFTIAGLTVAGAALRPDGVTVRLTTSAQTPSTNYTVACAAGRVLDLVGNGNTAGSRGFVGFVPADTQAPSVPTGVTATNGVASPTIAEISWTASSDNVGVVGYKVYRSVTSGWTTGTWELIGTSVGSPFGDTTGVPGQDYYYKVAAYDAAGNESALSGSSTPAVRATWVQAPHDVYSAATTLCKMCHEPHEAVSGSKILRPTGEAPAETAVCYACHDGSGANANIKTGPVNSFQLVAGSSGHLLKPDDASNDLTDSCAKCHNPHVDWASDNPLPKSKINNTAVTGADNSWCLACHNATNDWYGPGYPASAAPAVDATGFPVLGTFPTTTTPTPYVAYTDATLSAHLSIPASATVQREAGDCLYCHGPHRSDSAYDGLVADFQPPTVTAPADPAYDDYAALCFTCHGDNTYGFATAPANIKQFVTAGGARSGHRIKTTGGTYPQGAPLPCYECHNPHGSARGNTRLFSDALGDTLQTGTAAGDAHLVREFCFTCHTTTDTVTGWDSEANSGAGGYAAVTGDKIAGLPRDAALGANVLRLPDADGHHEADAQSCYQCHGADYGSGGLNVHNPSGGVSGGGVACYACHNAYQAPMEDGLGAKTGASRALSYHHVLGGNISAAYAEGDVAPGTGTYPNLTNASRTDVFCVSCHADHNYFNATKGANLRSSVTAVGSSTSATDYDSTTNTGVCTSCHDQSLTKQAPGTDQKDDGSTATPIIAAGAGASQFGASAHDYYATSSYGASDFSANCSKCHNDEQSKVFQSSTVRFGTHWSEVRRILTALGGTVADPLGENHCFRCHSRQSDSLKTTNLQDAYGAVAMTGAAERVYAQFQLASRHPVSSADQAGGDVVECESCHNPHVVTGGTTKVTDPMNGYDAYTYSTDAQQAAYCLKCHDGTPPTRTVNGTTYIPYTVTQADATANNKSLNGARGHWSQTGAIGSGEEVSCAECHDNHGSAAPKLLGAYDMTDSRNEIAGGAITANDNTVCAACHTSATGTAYTRLANSYPNVGTWPGMTAYNNATTGIHNGTVGTVVWPGATFADGDCKNCHDVHGTASPYDETLAQFGPSAGNDEYALCFTCHDSDGPSTRNIKQYFPTSVGGLATGGNYGHAIQSSGGTLAAGSALPCYDCHNPHGSAEADGLLVETSVGGVKYLLGDAAVEIDMTTAAGNRLFCFTCHTGDTSAADTTIQGTNSAGTGFIGISAATDYIEGIDRTVLDTTNKTGLHLPALNGHYTTLGSQGACYGCHGNSYASATSNNVHNPGPGGSSGGLDCYTCHSVYQTYMEDGTGTKTGSSRTLTYHHVMGSATNEGDYAFSPTTYPTSATDVYCLSCHVDHDKFNANKAANLRNNFSASPAGLNTDYAYTGSVNYYANTLTQTTGTWSNPTASTGAPDDLVATSPAPAFEGRHSFSLGSLSGISAATLSVRSRANWSGGAGGGSQILYPTSDVAVGNWAEGNTGADGDTLRYNEIDDPATTPGANDGATTYIRSSGTTEYTAGTANPTVPSSATNIMVTVVWTARDGATNTQTIFSRLRVGGTLYGTSGTTVQIYNPGTTFTTYGTTFAVNPNGGAAWTPATVNTINGLGFDTSGTTNMDVTQGYVIVTYDNVDQVRYPTSDVASGNWAEGVAGADGDASEFNEIDDPATTPGANDGATTYIRSTGTTEYNAGTPVPTVPAGSTDIMVTMVWTIRDGSSNTQTNYPRLRVNGTYYGTSQTTVGTVNPGTTFTTYAETFVLNPNGNAAWTPTTVNTVNGLGFDTSGTTNMDVTQAYVVVSYTPPPVTVDDTWAIQYSTNNGTSWSNVVAASTTNETALTAHPATPLDLTGILTDANYSQFLVRIVSTVSGTADPVSVDWDATTLSITTGGGNGVCMGCHTVERAKDTTNQKSFAAPPSTVTPALSVADYGASAHNFQATSTLNDSTTFGANCSKCHNDENNPAYKQFQTSTNRFGTHWSAERRILAAMGITVTDPLAEETECYRCHSLTADGQKSTTNQDWYGSVAMNATSQALYGFRTSTYSHNVDGYIGLHPTSPTDETQAYISSNKHVECGDCHNVHESAATRHTASADYQTASGNLVANSGALAGTSGVSATFSGTNWTAPTAYTQVTEATYEYQICFKCHSGANTNVTTWGGTGAASWTNQGLEFSPQNQSYHPVVAALPATDPGVNGSSVLAARDMRTAGTVNGQAVGGWANGDTMYCSDCHAESSAGSLGPHGSAVKWMLKGPNQAWPYTSAAQNGTSTGTYWMDTNRTLNADTANGLFCFNCHNFSTNGVHDRSGDHTIACVSCHIRVPHGGKVSRLLTGTNAPARYLPDGNGNWIAADGHLTGFIKRPAGSSYNDADCFQTGCSQHAAAGGEAW